MGTFTQMSEVRIALTKYQVERNKGFQKQSEIPISWRSVLQYYQKLQYGLTSRSFYSITTDVR